ncbi:MAG: hypothetical protein LIO90_07500 [Bacteroidales bacterium]|nr:hypothetical protein [Bacteroidales bacterium]
MNPTANPNQPFAREAAVNPYLRHRTAESNPQPGMWLPVTVSGVSALVFGAAGAYITHKVIQGLEETPADEVEVVEAEEPVANQSSLAYLTDGTVPFATGVNDSMSFSQAFATARAEVGPGGVFEWHGQLYGTYYATEWNSMSAEEKAAYNDHFAWSHHHHSTTHHDGGSAHTTGHHETPSQEVEVVDQRSAQHQEQPHATNTPTGQTGTTGGGGSTPAATDDGEVEIVGAYHDDSLGMNVGVARIEGEDVILFDVDNDKTFDVMWHDKNHDGQMDDNEITNIQGEHITTDHFGGLQNDHAATGGGGEAPASTGDDEIEIIGAYHDDATNTNVGVIESDGERAYLIDRDNDQTFDVMWHDKNHNGEVDTGEVTDISGAGITTDDLGGLQDYGDA